MRSAIGYFLSEFVGRFADLFADRRGEGASIPPFARRIIRRFGSSILRMCGFWFDRLAGWRAVKPGRELQNGSRAKMVEIAKTVWGR